MFKLNVECTKDIDELHINFSDGSSAVSTNIGGNKIKSEVQPIKASGKEQFLDLDADFGGISQEVVSPPQIDREERGVKVAEELQNFDF